ncbi:MAG: magnesium-translocating P-type ATPase [bacterium]
MKIKKKSVIQESLPFWSISTEDMLQKFKSNLKGLSSQDARKRLARYGSNLLKPKKNTNLLTLFLAQFKSPLILILLFAACLSIFVHEHVDAFIILGIVLISGLLGFWQEKGAANAIKKLLEMVLTTTTLLRDGKEKEIPIEEVVPGDIVVLNAGDIIPGDCLILESQDLFVDEATLTGETYPVEKETAMLTDKTPLAERTNALWMGTNVVSGTAKALVVLTGKATQFGNVSEHLQLRPAETDFEHGIRRFGYLLMEVTLVLVVAIFAINVYLAKPILDSFLFSLALAVGLTPQLLPMIISINLAHGAKKMATKKVIVKRLAAIENFGSMNVICSDKTGTLTEGVVHIKSALDVGGNECEKVLQYAYLNAFFETGFTNPIDEAIRNHQKFEITGYEKLDEVPYDFIRKRLSIAFSKDKQNIMVTKGALNNILEVCSSAEDSDGKVLDIAKEMGKIQKLYEELSAEGFRILGIAYKDVGSEKLIKTSDEGNMIFLGLLVLYDPLKEDILVTIDNLKTLGVSLKLITGDNHLVAAYVSKQIGVSNPVILTGAKMSKMSDGALLHQVGKVNVFAEIEPNQKERIIIALRKAGNVVGYMGDGINDASALHSADVGISVESAVDVAKEAADIVLLENNLSVLVDGVREGRLTFANTLKYVFMATSANFGNMFSMAGASLFMNFLPLLPKQILLTNLLTDIPEMTIASDSVDHDMLDKPRRWDIKFIRKFMMTFGLVSSIFDYMTFGALLLILKASPAEFRTGWFVESVISASMIVLVIRTRKPFYKSKPGTYLMIATFSIVAVTLLIPYSPIAGIFGFIPLPPIFLFMLFIIVMFYIFTAELAKKWFYRNGL